MTSEEARELVKIAQDAGVVHGVSFVYRQFAMVQQATFSEQPNSPGYRDVAGQAHFPGGHNEGWPDAFKNMMLNFYQAACAGKMPQENERRFASFSEGANVMYLIDAIVKSHQQQCWVSVEQ